LCYPDLNWVDSLLFSLKSLFSGEINQNNFWGNFYMQIFLFINLVIMASFVVAVMTKSEGKREMVLLKYI
jgi:hypothetical protein